MSFLTINDDVLFAIMSYNPTKFNKRTFDLCNLYFSKIHRVIPNLIGEYKPGYKDVHQLHM